MQIHLYRYTYFFTVYLWGWPQWSWAVTSNSNHTKYPLQEWPKPGLLHTIVAFLMRVNAQRTRVQFKEVSERTTIQAVAADINIPAVIPGQPRHREIPAKLKAVFCSIDWRLSDIDWGASDAACTVHFWCSYSGASGVVLKGGWGWGGGFWAKSKQIIPSQICQSRQLKISKQ